DPINWINEFERAATANNWSAARKLAIAKAYMYNNAKDWLKRTREEIQQYDTSDDDNQFKKLED
ncbi:9354_t:CDS:2, partial [Racocetra persica]